MLIYHTDGGSYTVKTNMANPIILTYFFNPELQIKIVEELRKIPYRKSPSFLGKFDYYKVTDFSTLPPFIGGIINPLKRLSPKQTFNTIFLQRYLDNSFVKCHRDPKNNVGKTIIAPFGDFKGALSTHGEMNYKANSGDVVIQDCTIDGVQGERHSVGTITGERYCVILNTIV